MNDHRPCPDLENLSAFVDGGLRGRKKRAILSHLDGCPRCRELVSGGFRFLDETEGEVLACAKGAQAEKPRFFRWPILAGAFLLLFLFLGEVLASWRAYQRGEVLSRAYLEARLAAGMEPPGFDLPLPTPSAPIASADPVRGVSLPTDGNFTRAVMAFDEVSRLSPTWRASRIRLISLYIANDNLAEARFESATLAKRYPNEPEVQALEALSQFLYANKKNIAGEMDRALGKMRLLNKAHPNSSRVENILNKMIAMRD